MNRKVEMRHHKEMNMEMLRDTLHGDLTEQKAKLAALAKHEDAAMQQVAERATSRMSEVGSNRHERRKHESIQRKIEKIEQLKRELKNA